MQVWIAVACWVILGPLYIRNEWRNRHLPLFPGSWKGEEMNIEKIAALARIFGRESCQDGRFVDWLIKKGS